MPFIIDVEEGAVALPITQAQLKKVLQLVFRNLRAHPQYRIVKDLLGVAPQSLGLRLCLDPEMRILNHHFRKLDRSTDVLSFPSLDLVGPELKALGGYLGDLVICTDALKRGSLKMKHSLAEEFVEVLIHGILHLLGLDHLGNRRKAEEMFELQGELFSHARSVIKLPHGKRIVARRSSTSKPARARRKT